MCNFFLQQGKTKNKNEKFKQSSKRKKTLGKSSQTLNQLYHQILISFSPSPIISKSNNKIEIITKTKIKIETSKLDTKQTKLWRRLLNLNKNTRTPDYLLEKKLSKFKCEHLIRAPILKMMLCEEKRRLSEEAMV